jgi:hypothetical protein
MSLLPFPRWLRNAFQCAALLLGLVAVLAAAEPGPAPSGLAARVAHAREEKKNDARLSALGEIARSLSLAEIPEALRLANGLSSLRERMALGDMALRRWGELAPAAAFAHVAAMPESYSKIETIRSVAVAFAKADGPSAAATALHMNPGRARLEAIQLVGETWASVDLPAALQWARTLPEGAGKEEVWRRIHFVWVHADPVAAAPSVQEFPAGEYRNALLMNVAANWAAIDPNAALRWTQALPAGEEQDTMQVMAVESWANADPLAACQFAEKLPPNLRPRAVLAALDRWATQDPHEALQWVSRQGDRFLSERGIAQVLNTCASVCPEDAAHWVEQLPLGPVRDNAIGAYVETVQTWDPAAATRLAALTADATARQQRVGSCFQQWRALDPEGAECWLAGADFPEETKRGWRAERIASAP